MSTPDDRSILELLASLRHVTQKDAAKGQLETAIWLWFHAEDIGTIYDPTSVHTLTVAVQGILTAVARDKGVEPSNVVKITEKQPEKIRDWIRNPQNFFKHGKFKRMGRGKIVPHLPDLTELFLADNIGAFNRVFKLSSPILDLYLFRYSLTFPESKVSLKTFEVELIKRGYDLGELARLDRIGFYQTVAPILIEFWSTARKAHLDKPPESEKP